MDKCFLEEHLSHCTLCPRKCGVNRLSGETGFCGASDTVRVARAALHFWEEPCLSGEAGSGTVFFSFCTLKCVFCQNYEISTCRRGVDISLERLSEIFLELQEQGALNINLVTPTHYIPQIVCAVRHARQHGLVLPIVYNSSGYETPESIRLLEGIVDIYLPDFKYVDDGLARNYSHAPNYAQYALDSITAMVEQVGAAQFDAHGIMKKGVLVRHLLLPEQIDDTKRVIQTIAQRFGDRVYLSLMNQYTPLAHVKRFPELDRTLDPLDYRDAVSYALSKGIRQGFVQEDETAKESFIPHFDGEGVVIQHENKNGNEA